MKTKLFLVLYVTLLAMVQGAWAQTEVSTESALNEALSGESPISIKLTADITLKERMSIPEGKTVTLDLNGHTLRRNQDGYHWFFMVIHNNGNLTINDSSGDNSGKITGGRAYGGGGIYCEANSTLTFNGGTVIGNSVTYSPESGGGFGGGVYINAGAEATFNGGVISGNSAPQGGGIYNYGTLTIGNNALISGNTGNDGGGIFNRGTLNINGGSITANLANTLGGGGIYNYGTINMTGGSITTNTSTTAGGGIWNGGTLNMQGIPVVSGNTSTTNGVDNVFLNDNKVISVTGAFAEGTKIGVAPSNTSNAITSNYSTYNPETTPDSFFSSDTEFHKLSLNGDSEVALVGAAGNWIDYKSEEITHKDGNTWYIESPEDLAHVAYHVKAGSSDYYGITFVLNTDLDMSAHYWTPIGTDSDHRFKGNFNGNGHTISGIYVNSTVSYNGLFGYVVGSAAPSGYEQKGCDYIKNFVLKDSYIKGGDCTGSVVGLLWRGATLENVVCQADVTGGADVGGIVGLVSSFNENDRDYPTKINNCLFLSGTVSATGNRAAVIGTIVNYYNLLSLSNNYYIDPTSYVGNDNDVRAYPITTIIPDGSTCSYNAGVDYNGIHYHPAGNAYLTVKHDFGKSVAAKVNGDDVVAVEGAIPFTINPAKAESYEVIVTLNDYEFTGSGTEAAPYLITSQDDWNYFASCLNSGSAPDNYSGTYFKLDTDIIVNQRMGANDHPFCGIFDGSSNTLTLAFGSSESYSDQECAAFYRIDNSTIKNLIIGGSIYSSAQHNASLAVKSTGSNNYIQNCISSVSINSSIEGDCTNGGFIGILDTDGTYVYFNGCAFVGELVGANTTNWGGFLGWREYGGYFERSHAHFTDCLFAPTNINIATPDGSNSRTFCRSTDNTTDGAEYNNSYYTTVLQAADGGKQAYGTTTAPANMGAEGTEYNVSGITTYGNGLLYGGRYYTDCIGFYDNASNTDLVNDLGTTYEGKQVNVTLTGRTLYRDGDWNTLCLPFDVELEGSPLKVAEARTLSEASFSDGTLTLNFSEPVTTLNAGTPYIIKWNKTDFADLVIKTTADWDAFASAVNGGNDYSGKTVVLDADIEVETMVGTNGNRFKGTFDGDGHKLTFTATTSEQYCAPFRYVENATIMNLHTTGTITTSKKFGTGLVGYTKGTTVINNCWSSVSIISSVSGDGSHGGFVGYTEENASNTTLTNCLFDGSITGASTNSCGGLIGWNYDKATLNNCVFRPTSITLANSDNATFSRGSNVTVTNCYYSQNLPGASGQGTAIGEMTEKALLSALGSGWTESESKVAPIVTKASDIINPVFNGVTINATASTTTTPTGDYGDGKVSFIGNYSPEILNANDKSSLYLGAENQLYWPTADCTINAFRGYFHVDLSGASQVREIRLNFGDEVTSIHNSKFKIHNYNGAKGLYNLSGQKVSDDYKGIVIKNGKKYVKE